MQSPKDLKKKHEVELMQKALVLSNKGYTLREVADIIGKSHEWVRQALIKLSTDKSLTK